MDITNGKTNLVNVAPEASARAGTQKFSSKKDVGDKTGTLESTKNGAEETPCLRACWCLF